MIGNEGLVTDELFGINEVDGTPLYKRSENPAWKMLLNCRKRRDDLFDQLAATRKIQMKFDKRDVESYDKTIQRIKKRYKTLVKEATDVKFVEIEKV